MNLYANLLCIKLCNTHNTPEHAKPSGATAPYSLAYTTLIDKITSKYNTTHPGITFVKLRGTDAEDAVFPVFWRFRHIFIAICIKY
jgi:hypothetical protein